MEQQSRRLVAESLLNALGRNSAAAERATVNYSGSSAAVDALWWVVHPRTAAPSGVADPRLELEALRVDFFSRDGQLSEPVDVVHPATGKSVRMRASEARILECEHRLSRDAAAVDTMLAVYSSETAGATTSVFTPAADRRADASTVHREERLAPAGATGASGIGASDTTFPGQATPGSDVVDASSRVGRLLARARRVGPVVPVLFASLGVVVGAALTWAVAVGGLGLDPVPLGAPSANPTATSGPPRALSVFGRAPTETDRLPNEYFLGAPQVTGRLLYSDGALRVWAYRDRGEVCLFLQDGEAAAGTCTTEELFVENGLVLPLPDHGVTMTNGSSGTPAAALAELTWTPEGAIEIHAISVLP